MAKKINASTEKVEEKAVPVYGFKSKAMAENRILTDVYTTDPRTVITVKGRLSDGVVSQLLNAVDSVLEKNRL